MKRRGNLLMKMVKLKAMGFLCGLGIFVASMAMASGELVLSAWQVEHLLVPLMLAIVSAGAWFIRSIDRRLSKLAEQVAGVGSRISHIEGKLDISQTGGHVR
jgi:hypothetical protein